MQHLGLSHAESRAYGAALASAYSLRIRVAFCDLEEKPIASLAPRVLPGSQIDLDTSADVTRMLSMSFLDPRNVLDLDPRSRDAGSLFLDRIVKVYYSVWVDALGRWVTAQPFTGLPWKLTRDGAVVTIEAHGKERLAMRPCWRPFTRGAGKAKIDVLEDFMRQRVGEARIDFPAMAKPQLPKPWSVARQQIMWPRARQLAHSMDKQLFYDGRGVATVRHLPGHPVRTFRRGDGGSLVTELQIDSEVADFANTGMVTGRKQLQPGIAQLKPPHPLAPGNLARNGVPGVIAVFAANDHIRNNTEADNQAVRLLDHQTTSEVSYSYSVLPDPRLDELDMVAVERLDGSLYMHRVTKATLPLDGEAMTMGYHRRASATRRDIRKR
jgi:hypothetical protein